MSVAPRALAAIATWLAACLAIVQTARRRYAFVTVRGPSMSPTLVHGDWVLVDRSRRPRRGDVVALRLPLAARDAWRDLEVSDVDLRLPKWVIKRAVALGGDMTPGRPAGADRVPAGHVFVLGDNDRSMDSRHWGPVAEAVVLGVATRRVRSGPSE